MSQTISDNESRDLDRGAARTAVSTLEPILERLSTDAVYYADTLPPTSAELAAGAIDVWDDGDGEVNFVQALLMREILAGQLDPRSFGGDVDVQQADVAQVIVRHGSLQITGSLRLHAMLMVLGDLHVGVRLVDAVKASRLGVTGSVTCMTLRIGSPFWVAGDVTAEAVCFDPGGKLWVGGELRAKIVIGCRQSAGVTSGRMNVTYNIRSAEWDDAGPATVRKLEGILVPEALKRADRERGIFQPDDLLDLIEAGRPYLREMR